MSVMCDKYWSCRYRVQFQALFCGTLNHCKWTAEVFNFALIFLFQFCFAPLILINLVVQNKIVIKNFPGIKDLKCSFTMVKYTTKPPMKLCATSKVSALAAAWLPCNANWQIEPILYLLHRPRCERQVQPLSLSLTISWVVYRYTFQM